MGILSQEERNALTAVVATESLPIRPATLDCVLMLPLAGKNRELRSPDQIAIGTHLDINTEGHLLLCGESVVSGELVIAQGVIRYLVQKVYASPKGEVK